MKVLVTGADGFIGSHLVEKLIKSGYDVRAMALYNSFDSRGWIDTMPQEVQSQFETVCGDIRDASFVRNSLQGCNSVLNLAALIAIPYSYVAPDSYVSTNVNGALNVVQAARDFGIDKIVQVSTSEVYGSAQFVPITEEHPLVGQSPYAATKIGADQLAMSFWKSFETPVAIARPFNTYGPRQSTRAVIPTIITQIASGQRDISLGALHPTRDFNFVEDTVRGLIAVLESQKSIGEVINIGSGFEVSIRETVQMIAEVMGVDVTISQQDERQRPEKSEVDRLHACNKKALAKLNWQPNFAGVKGMKEGLAITAEWFSNKSNLDRYRLGTYTV